MIKKALLQFLTFAVTFSLFTACGSDDTVYSEVPEPPVAEVSPVVLDLNAEVFPYTKLSDYNFFEGDMKNLDPVYKVIPYDLNSSLFTDYAKKKRFVYMPAGTEATYSADGKVLEFPVGTALIKNFYYDNIAPDNTTKLIETRLMVRKSTGWIFATYVWNSAQDEAVLNNSGSFAHLSIIESGVTLNFNYRVPSAVECGSCHKLNEVNMPIGVKPQNLNKMFTYTEGSKNQLTKLVGEGYLSNTNLPQQIISTVDWTDTSKSLDTRVRSYLDINCAHCHSQGTSCDYTPMRLAFSESGTPAALGVCIEPVEFVTGSQTHIIAKKSIGRSLMHFRMSTTLQSEMMPQVGRTLVHAEAVQMLGDWINAMDAPCP